MPTTRVKICGITRPEDATLAAELGADAIGLNFFAGPRKLSMEQALPIMHVVPPLTHIVGLTSDDPEFFKSESERDRKMFLSVFYKFDFYQLYGVRADGAITNTTPARFWSVFPIAAADFVHGVKSTLAAYARPPAAILLDTASKSGQLGGTGESFNWNWIAEARAAGELDNLPPIILAGGLTPDNVAAAIRIAKPYAVDVSSGVEVPNKPGVKDPIKLRDFIQAAKSAL